MLDYLQAFSLLGLILTHYFLVRGCFSIRQELPIQGGEITSRLDRTADLLDEVAQLIADLGDSTPSGAVAHTPSSPLDLLGAFLNNRMNTASQHAPPNEEWEILPNNDDTPPTSQA